MKEWEKHRDEMVQLYQVHKLGRVMEIMTQRHNFHAWYAKKQVLFKKHLALTIPLRAFYTPPKIHSPRLARFGWLGRVVPIISA